jgi:hypothetical protein
MSGETEDRGGIAAIVTGFQGKKPRLDYQSLKAAAEAGRKTLLPSHVDASKIIPDPEPPEGEGLTQSEAESAPAPKGKAPGRRRALGPTGDQGGKGPRTSLQLRGEVHRAVRLYAVRNGTTLNDVINNLVEAEFKAGRFS